MATRIYSTSPGLHGGDDFGVTEAVGPAMTSTEDVELVFDLAPGWSKAEVLECLRRIERALREEGFPPA